MKSQRNPQDSGDAQKLVQSAVKTIELNERQVETAWNGSSVTFLYQWIHHWGISEDFLRLLLLIFWGVLMWDPQVTMALYGFQY